MILVEWIAVLSTGLGLGFAWMALRPSPAIWGPINNEIDGRIQAAIDLTAEVGTSGSRSIR